MMDWTANYRKGIQELKLASADEEIPLSGESCRDFWQLTQSHRPSPQAELVLTDQGNLIAIWQETTGATVEVEFLSHQQCKRR